jgi:kinesin family protein 18/19
VVKVLDGKVVIVTDEKDDKDVLRVNRSREKRYAFDHAFDVHTTQEQIFQHTTKHLIDGFLNGFNATVFAYGATGTGKTYTMVGTPTSPGNMVLTMESIFEQIRRSPDKTYTVTLSYLEIYNELIHDLLRGGGSNPEASKLDLREDPSGSVNVAGLSAMQADSTEEVMELLRKGNQHRTMEPTHANAVSSRSHAVLQITCEQKDKTANTSHVVKVGKLSLIDLAGSERATQTHNVGARMLEGANINRSLLALGNCINALAGNSSRKGYIPYRDSKLTRLLKDSLGGNCRTVMIVTTSPSHLYQEETLNTLKYANRAKNIKTSVHRNVQDVNYHVAQYMAIIAELRSEISDLKSNQQTGIPESSPRGSIRKNTAQEDIEKSEMKKLLTAVNGNYKERVEVRRQLLELNDLNLNNKIQISKRQLEVHRWEKENAGSDKAVPSWVAAARNDVKTAKSNVAKNNRLQRELEIREQDLLEEGTGLREESRRVIQNDERRSLLEKQFEMSNVEIEKMQLQQGLKSHTGQLVERDLRIRKLTQRVEASNDIIKRQKQLLEEHGIQDDTLTEPRPFSAEESARESSGYARKREDHTPRADGQHLPRLGSNAKENHGPGPTRTRSRQRSREGLLGQVSRLNSSRAGGSNRKDSRAGGSRNEGRGPPVLVTVSPRRSHGSSESRGFHPSPAGSSFSREPDSARAFHRSPAAPSRENGERRRFQPGSKAPRAPSAAPSVRSNEVDYGQSGNRGRRGAALNKHEEQLRRRRASSRNTVDSTVEPRQPAARQPMRRRNGQQGAGRAYGQQGRGPSSYDRDW